MQAPLRADGPLATPSSDPDARPPRQPLARRGRFRGFGILRLLLVVASVVVLAGSVAGYGLYNSLRADLPDYRWLADRGGSVSRYSVSVP